MLTLSAALIPQDHLDFDPAPALALAVLVSLALLLINWRRGGGS